MTTKLYSKSIISSDALLEAVNENHIASVRTVSLLSVVEDKIRTEPHVFTEFVKILESEPTLRSQANELVKKYRHGMYNRKLTFLSSLILFSGLDTVPVPHTSATTSSAISRYGDYLEGVYSRSSVSSDSKFPPTPSKTYVRLAVVERADQIRDIQQVIHGRVDNLLKGKKEIRITDILKPQDNGSPVSLVFVEGPPGIGKSTLAWELCRKWDRKQYDLAVLLRLREREVQQIESIAGLFPHINQDLQLHVTKEIVDREGRGVLIILDGYDELPISLRYQGLLIKLLKGVVLPKCSVLVTSRPSASRDLFRACRPQIQRHVEILGFTQESVIDYANSVFFSEPELLRDFLVYVSASQNPALNSLMYIPLNAAIIVEIYKNSRRKGYPIPNTMTQVYTQLCLTLLQRYLDNINPLNMIVLDSFSDLPNNYYDHLKNLSRLAFEQFQKHRIVFYSDSVGKELVHFGLLDSVPALYGGGGVSYNFLHFTLQEFLAAYHITQLSSGRYVFNQYCMDGRWEVVWRFLSGLTGFKYFENSVQNPVFSRLGKEGLQVKNLFLHCLFEDQVQDMFDCLIATGRNFKTVNSYQECSSPLDRYVLGYCIANCSTTTSWKVHILDGSDESFMWGLSSNHRCNGIISHLTLALESSTCLDAYPENILHGIKYLESDHNLFGEKVIPLMNNLTTLCFSNLPYPYDNGTMLTSFSNLIHSPKLKCVTIGHEFLAGELLIIPKPLCDILFGPSSFNELNMLSCKFKESCLDSLETNTNLTKVSFSSCWINHKVPPFQTLSRVLQNKTIQKLQVDVTSCREPDLEQVYTFIAALSNNTSLQHLKLVIDHQDCTHDWSFITDSRVTIVCENNHCYDLSDEKESDEEGSDEEESDEEGSDEEESDEEGSDEEESDEEGSEEGSDEEGSEEGSEEEVKK